MLSCLYFATLLDRAAFSNTLAFNFSNLATGSHPTKNHFYICGLISITKMLDILNPLHLKVFLEKQRRKGRIPSKELLDLLKKVAKEKEKIAN